MAATARGERDLKRTAEMELRTGVSTKTGKPLVRLQLRAGPARGGGGGGDGGGGGAGSAVELERRRRLIAGSDRALSLRRCAATRAPTGGCMDMCGDMGVGVGGGVCWLAHTRAIPAAVQNLDDRLVVSSRRGATWSQQPLSAPRPACVLLVLTRRRRVPCPPTYSPSLQSAIERLRQRCLARGSSGIRGFARVFKIMDDGACTCAVGAATAAVRTPMPAPVLAQSWSARCC